ncbi:MAG: HNH endonuclease signature motif containing protein [Planctomycetota bacterium]
MKREGRPAIPAEVKRRVRQRCGFGCVICGLPLYEMDHIQPWATEGMHDEANLTLLCDRHHREKTSGLLPIEALKRANTSPRNRRIATTHPYELHYFGEEITCVLGSCSFSSDLAEDTIVAIGALSDELLWFTFWESDLLINAMIPGESGHPAIKIIENELVLHTGEFDIEFVGKSLAIRRSLRGILLKVVFEPPSRISIVRANINMSDFTIDISKHGVRGNRGSHFHDCHVAGVPVGFAFAYDRRGPRAFSVPAKGESD